MERMAEMSPQEKIRFFWATGVLPGTMFDDLSEKKIAQPAQRRRKRFNWLRLVSLGLVG